MTDIGAMVGKLIAAGTPPEVAAEVVAEVFAAGVLSRNSTGIPVDSVAEKRRAYDRKRKRVSGGIPPESTGTPPDSAECTSLSKELKEEREGKAHRIPPEWSPSPDDLEFAKVEGFAETEIDREISKFRDYWISIPGGKGIKLDWSPVWRKWIRDGADRRKRDVPAAGSPKVVAELVEDEKFWESAISSWLKFGRWSTQHAGPDPDSPACRCPPAILRKHGLGMPRAVSS